jgi:hypothetical protein
MGEMSNAYRDLSENLKMLIGRPRLIWEYNNKMDLKEIWYEYVDRLHMAKDWV